MFLIARAITDTTLFVGIVLVFLPLEFLNASQIDWPASIGASQAAWIFLAGAGAGAALTLWCMLTLVFVGQGTPAPFDPPRQLVVSGPYRYSRNPMYIGAGIMVFGAALFYQSLALFSYGIALSRTSASV